MDAGILGELREADADLREGRRRKVGLAFLGWRWGDIEGRLRPACSRKPLLRFKRGIAF